jgi:hypothetical protein
MALQVKDGNDVLVTVSFSASRDASVGNAAENIKTSAGRLVAYALYNPTNDPVWVNFYNDIAANITLGSTAPLWQDLVGPLSPARLALPPGIDFTTAISINASTAVDGTGAPSSNLIRSVAYL